MDIESNVREFLAGPHVQEVGGPAAPRHNADTECKAIGKDRLILGREQIKTVCRDEWVQNIVEQIRIQHTFCMAHKKSGKRNVVVFQCDTRE